MRNFEHTMDILVKAYFNGKLKHNWCHACAVGNICGGRPEWKYFFCTSDGKQAIFLERTGTERFWAGETISREQALEVIESTGYTVKELARIEFAFETAHKGNSDDAWMFNGLMAVLEVLADIHGVDLSGKKVYEKQLIEIYNQ